MFGSNEQIIEPAKYIYNTFEEYFSTHASSTKPDKDQKDNSFYLSNYVLKTMNEKLYGGSKYSLSQYTTQELLEATLITKDLDKSNSILKKLPNEIIKKILVEHVGAQELGLIANRGRIEINNYIKAKEEFETINDKKLAIEVYRGLTRQKLLYKKAEQLHRAEVDRLKLDNKIAELQHSRKFLS